jgi:AcrR family transcriptional regulator
MSAASPAVGASRRIRQKRSQKTYDALIATAFKLLEEREFDEISVAELAQKAGYSVGAFYARFKSKDELFEAMLAQHFENRRVARAKVFAETPDDSLIYEHMRQTVGYYWARRRFWRAALFRSIRDPGFWEPVRTLSYELADLLIERISARVRRALSETEEMNVRFGVQVALGTINNTIINRPGPIFMDQELFVENLARALRLVSGFDELVTAKRKTKRTTKRGRRQQP